METKRMNRRDFLKNVLLLLGGLLARRWINRSGKKPEQPGGLTEAKYYSSPDKLLG